MVKTENKYLKGKAVLSYLKASIIAIIVTLVLILIFALVLKLTGLSDSIITPVNLVIKAVSIAIGTIILAKNGEGGLKKGIILGVIFTAIAFVLFSILNGSFNFSYGLLADFAFGAVVGGIVGVITVNVKKA